MQPETYFKMIRMFHDVAVMMVVLSILSVLVEAVIAMLTGVAIGFYDSTIVAGILVWQWIDYRKRVMDDGGDFWPW